MTFTRWMSSALGRILRVLAGLVLIGLGFYVQGVWGWVIGVVGVIPILAGAFNFCLLGPILGAPFNGRRIVPQG